MALDRVTDQVGLFVVVVVCSLESCLLLVKRFYKCGYASKDVARTGILMNVLIDSLITY